jgi:hypothetical protein
MGAQLGAKITSFRSSPAPLLHFPPTSAAAMDIYDFGARFAPGYTLSVEERAALEVQMAKRQAEERLHRFVPSSLSQGPRGRPPASGPHGL